MLPVLGYALVIVVTLGLFVFSFSTLLLATYAWWNADNRTATEFARLAPSRKHGFSIIMPCRNEREDVMMATLERLLNQSHPNVEVIISVGHDDLATVEIAHDLADLFRDRVRVSVDYSPVKNKPRQLNSALPMCRNDIVGVFDAESIAAPELLDHIDSAFQHADADVVQGAVQLVNFRDSWFSLRNCLEYFIWFRSRLHAHAKEGFIPLGGNTVFVRRELLVAVGGWDGDCLAEDCDLGVRLSTLRHRIVVAYAPALVTREETPDTVSALVRQRTRWALGFMQVYAKGDWRKLTGSRRLNAWWTLTQQHLMAFAGVCIPLAITFALLAKLPLPVTLITFLPLIPTLLMIVLEVCMLREFGQDHGFHVRALDYIRLVVFAPVYSVLLAIAAIRAVIKFATDDFRWEKTAHSGAHLSYLDDTISTVALEPGR